jgi:phosphoglycolate phosphatase
MSASIVFDLDGTLVDSRRDIADAANALLAECGGKVLPEEVIGAMVGDGAAALVARAFDRVGVGPPADALERFLRIYSTCLFAHTRPYPGIPEALAILAARARLAVLTNKPLQATRQILDGLDLSRYFAAEAIVGGDGPWPRKPDPAGLRYLISQCGADAPGAGMLVGDSLVDWKTARAAGARVCLVRYGFGFAGVPSDTLGPDDLVVDQPAELTRVL